MSSKNLLENIYLFKGLSSAEMAVIEQACDVETVLMAEDVFSQGDVAKALYIVKYGSVRIHQQTASGDNIEIAVLGTGSHFGEMAFIDSEKRSASATAVEKTELIVIDYTKLTNLLIEQPKIAVHVYKELAHFLCGRLRVTTNDLSFAREKNLSHF